MLNIEEVKRRLRDNPEPIEVTKIREKILNSFNKLIFKEDTHQYFLPKKDGELVEYNSVSKTIHQFIPYVDWNQKAIDFAIKNGLDVNEVQKTWHYNNIIATNEGTGVHLYGEEYMKFVLGIPETICDIIKPQYQDGYLLPHGPKERACCKFNEDLFYEKNLYPVLSETRVYTSVGKIKLKQNYAGTFDLLMYYKHPTDNSKSGLILFDYKTNKELTKEYSRNFNIMMLEPFEEFFVEDLSTYTIQLSAYEIPLLSIGIPVLGRRIIWLKPDETYEKIKLNSVSDKLINLYK